MNQLLSRISGVWGSLEPRERMMIGGLVAALIIGLLGFALYQLSAKESRLRRQLAFYEDEIDQMSSMFREIDEIDAKLQGVELPIGPRCNVNLFTTLESILRSCGAENISIRPLTVPQSDYYTEQAVEVELRRILLQTVVGCLYQIDSSPSEYRAWRFQAKKRFDDPNQLDVRFQVSTFCGKEAGT